MVDNIAVWATDAMTVDTVTVGARAYVDDAAAACRVAPRS